MQFIGRSKHIATAVEKARSLAKNSEPCVIVGEKGVGKAHLAHFIHTNSPREAEPFLIFDAANEKEAHKRLFGFLKTNIIGIESLTTGAIDAAGSGTLFIKNLQLIPHDVQLQLVATIQLGGYRPVDSEESLVSTCRYLFSLPKDIEEHIKEKGLLPELAQLFKRNMIHLSPLKERGDDVHLLADHFLRKWCASLGLSPKMLTKAAHKLLKKYSWPENVSELQMLLLHATLSFSENVLDAHHLQLKLDGNWRLHTEKHLEETALEEIIERKLRQFMQKLGKYDIEDLHGTIIDRVERPLIKLVMEKTGNNQLRAARILGINRNTLRAKLQKLEIM